MRSANQTSRFTLRVATPAGAVEVACERKRVKNLNLRVHGDGRVTMSAPLSVSDQTIREFLERRGPWIAERLERLGNRREAEDPERFALWGELASYRERGIAPEQLPGLYAEEVARALPDVIESYEGAMGVHARGWSVRQMKTRWGSCTPARRTIRINAALAAYPPACLDFVVAHELVHLMEPSHNQRFHTLLDIYCPHNREAAARLKRPPAGPAAG